MERFSLVSFSIILLGVATHGNCMEHVTLHEAAQQGDLEKVQQLLSKGVDVNEQNDQGVTPLHQAALCKDDRSKIINTLVAGGADVTLTTYESGNTPLHLVECIENAQALIEAGANPNAQRHLDGRTPLDYLMRTRLQIESHLPLIRWLIARTDLLLQNNNGNMLFGRVLRLGITDTEILQAFINRARETHCEHIFCLWDDLGAVNMGEIQDNNDRAAIKNLMEQKIRDNNGQAIKYLMEQGITFDHKSIRRIISKLIEKLQGTLTREKESAFKEALSFFLKHYVEHINELNEKGNTLLAEVERAMSPIYSWSDRKRFYNEIRNLLIDHGIRAERLLLVAIPRQDKLTTGTSIS
jgi:hypothetical protein